jgi:formate dehydrogenase subunit gamma
MSTRAVALIAEAYGAPRSEIFALLSAHRGFRRLPPTDGALRLCLADRCKARGAEALAARLAEAGVGVETALCLRNCDHGPNASFDGEMFSRLDGGAVERLIAMVQFRRNQKNDAALS